MCHVLRRMRRGLANRLLGPEAEKATETRKKLVKARKQRAELRRKLTVKRREVELAQAHFSDTQALEARLREAQVSSASCDALSRPAPTPEEASLYLDLMKRCLTGLVYADQGKPPSIYPTEARPLDAQMREEGRDWPEHAQTMIGLKRLDNLQACVEGALQEGVPGDLIETGVWRGGATIFMRAILGAYGVKDRRVWVADSFEGLPPPDPEKVPEDEGYRFDTLEELAVSLEEVKSNFRHYGLLDEQVHFLKGWFQDTLPEAPIQRLAVLRLDGDMYQSTMDALVNLYPKLSPGGYCIVDDYGALPPCRQAVHDYREAHGIGEEIVPIDWSGIFWRQDR